MRTSERTMSAMRVTIVVSLSLAALALLALAGLDFAMSASGASDRRASDGEATLVWMRVLHAVCVTSAALAVVTFLRLRALLRRAARAD